MSPDTAVILSEGHTIVSDELISIDIVKEVNRIPYASLTLRNGDIVSRSFPLSESNFFEPGRMVKIQLQNENDQAGMTSVFEGLVVKQMVETNDRGCILTVELKDRAVRLTQNRRSMIHSGDDNLFDKLIKQNGLPLDYVEPIRTQHGDIVQYDCTDWDLLLTRADLLGLLVVSESGWISVRKVDLKGAAKHSYEFGRDVIYNFELEVDGTHQLTSVESFALDPKGGIISSGTPVSFHLAQGNIKAETVAKAVGGWKQILSSIVPLDEKTLKAWANGALIRNRMSMLRGRFSIPGSGREKCLDLIEIKGVGQRFNGRTIITGIRHRFDLNGWKTDIQFGLSPDRYVTRHEVTQVPAAGHIPAVNGIQIGIVTQTESVNQQFRVKVEIPGTGIVWALLATPDAGPGSGYFFRPERGDQVVLGFLNDDPRQAVILGSLFGLRNSPPEKMKTGVDTIQNGIVSRKGITLGFMDKNEPAFFIETPAANKIVVDDGGRQIQITDQHGNSIVMDQNGISIKSAKDLKIEANGRIEIKGASVDLM